jgi:hypothetical protein
MGKRNKVPRIGGFMLFDVLYQDGARSSNRKVPAEQLAGIEGDAAAKAYIEAQDRKIAETSGKPRAPIRSLSRSPGR